MEVQTAWVKPPQQIGGLDHLAVQAPCINIYARLLPGITNVTDRARYYSFYPWLIWAFDRQGHTTFDAAFIERFRRADCLFSLIAERHAEVSGGHYDDHAAAMVGSDTLGPLVRELEPGRSLKLSKYSAREGAKIRYFKNKLGGLGQYYLGVLRELEALDGDSSSGIKYTRQVGEALAKSLEEGFESELFLDCVDSDSVNVEQLDALSALCPCRLPENSGERELLGDLFFARGKFFNLEFLSRRRTLQLILHLSGELSEAGQELTESIFRACAYTSSLPNGVGWQIPETLEVNRRKWAIYSRNELLSIAAQGLFSAILFAYEKSGLRLASSGQIISWYLDQEEAFGPIEDVGEGRSYAESVAHSPAWLPALEMWGNSLHEIQLAERIIKLTAKAPDLHERREIVEASLRVLISLAGRGSPESDPYSDFVFDERYFQSYPINLRSFSHHSKQTWSALSLRGLLEWVLLNWGLELHLRVALRKLRGQSKSTFRIRPTDIGMEVTTAPSAVSTRPRFRQAVRVLKDIGALERTDTGLWQPSAFGTAMIGLADAP